MLEIKFGSKILLKMEGFLEPKNFKDENLKNENYLKIRIWKVI